MEIGQKVWMPNRKEIVKIVSVNREWTSYPHGSGTYYNVYVLEREDKSTFEYDEMDERPNNPMLSTEYLRNKNEYLEESIKDVKLKIKENEEIIRQLIKSSFDSI